MDRLVLQERPKNALWKPRNVLFYRFPRADDDGLVKEEFIVQALTRTDYS